MVVAASMIEVFVVFVIVVTVVFAALAIESAVVVFVIVVIAPVVVVNLVVLAAGQGHRRVLFEDASSTSGLFMMAGLAGQTFSLSQRWCVARRSACVSSRDTSACPDTLWPCIAGTSFSSSRANSPGVAPASVCANTSAPWLSKSFTLAAWPRLAATCNGAHLRLSSALALARAVSSWLTSLAVLLSPPCSAQRWSAVLPPEPWIARSARIAISPSTFSSSDDMQAVRSCVLWSNPCTASRQLNREGESLPKAHLSTQREGT